MKKSAAAPDAAASAPARERLIESTRQLLWDRGYLGTSPTAILRRSGVGQGSMYHHFDGKPALALAAEQRSAHLMQTRIREVFSGGGSALEKIVVYLLLERDVLRGCSVGRLAGDPDVIADDALRTPVQETFAVLLDCLTEAVTEAQSAGDLDPRLRPERTAATLAAVVQGGYALARAEQSDEPFNRAVRGALDLLGVDTDEATAAPGREGG
ncbi:TetR family transcriptional regulator C-terminal domain-containing protein [Streptomyces sp. NPDC085932]|uniref:TetR family transcriptional regulator C-terminal domain-containing protein n=1 Tax=Streptomyces sp. NPDC085932 TaxID=3365741 RepID=UPI0037D94CC7